MFLSRMCTLPHARRYRGTSTGMSSSSQHCQVSWRLTSTGFDPFLLAGGLVFSPYKDVGTSMNWNSYAMSTNVTGALTPVSQVMPAGMEVPTWAFATGKCGSESWAGVSTADIATNVQLFLQSGKRYILSTGGAAGAFTCSSDAGFETFLSTYASANLVRDAHLPFTRESRAWRLSAFLRTPHTDLRRLTCF